MRPRRLPILAALALGACGGGPRDSEDAARAVGAASETADVYGWDAVQPNTIRLAPHAVWSRADYLEALGVRASASKEGSADHGAATVAIETIRAIDDSAAAGSVVALFIYDGTPLVTDSAHEQRAPRGAFFLVDDLATLTIDNDSDARLSFELRTRSSDCGGDTCMMDPWNGPAYTPFTCDLDKPCLDRFRSELTAPLEEGTCIAPEGTFWNWSSRADVGLFCRPD